MVSKFHGKADDSGVGLKQVDQMKVLKRCNLRLNSVLFFCAAISLSVSAAAASTGSIELSCGFAFYRSAHYAEAIIHLTRATDADPYNATAHYYLACAYQQLGRSAQAITHYKLAKELDSDGNIGKYASQALTSYAAVIVPKIKATQPVVDVILKQTDERISRQGREGQMLSQQSVAAQSHTAKSLDIEASKFAALDESVASLRWQLQTGRLGQSKVQLLPEGTSLFVRNYAVAPETAQHTDAQQPELTATQKQLLLIPHKSSKKSVWEVVPVMRETDQNNRAIIQPKQSIQLKVHAVMAPRNAESKSSKLL
jgi:tetratricopeptide (TPR) repeat protein